MGRKCEIGCTCARHSAKSIQRRQLHLESKRCGHCKIEKPRSAFHVIRKKLATGIGEYLAYICKDCDQALRRERARASNITATHKVCPACKVNLELAEFFTRTGFVRNECRECARRRARRWRDANPNRPETTARRLRWSRSKSTGLNAEVQLRLMEALGSKCNICGAERGSTRHGLSLDHDHATREARGFLCGNCNHLLGKAKDDPVLLLKAVEYLRNPPARAFLQS